MSKLISDEEAREIFKTDRITHLYDVEVGPAWVGAGALDEFRDGRGEDDDSQ